MESAIIFCSLQKIIHSLHNVGVSYASLVYITLTQFTAVETMRRKYASLKHNNKQLRAQKNKKPVNIDKTYKQTFKSPQRIPFYLLSKF